MEIILFLDVEIIIYLKKLFFLNVNFDPDDKFWILKYISRDIIYF